MTSIRDAGRQRHHTNGQAGANVTQGVVSAVCGQPAHDGDVVRQARPIHLEVVPPR